MSSRKQSTAPALQVVEEPTVERDVEYLRSIRSLIQPTAIRSQADEAIKADLGRLISAIDEDVNVVVDRLIDDGLTLDEINEFACIQIALLPEVSKVGARMRFSWRYKIVEFTDEPAESESELA